MRWHRQFLLRVRSLLNKNAVESELDSEMHFHLEMQIRQNVAKGMPADEARYAALRTFGGVEQHKDECRDERRVNVVETLVADVRHGIRLLAKSPAFTLVAVLTLALGIGVTTAIFSVVNAALVRPLPFADQDRLVFVWQTRPEKGQNDIPAAPGDFLDWRAHSTALVGLAATGSGDVIFAAEGEPERITGQAVSANLFDLLGVKPSLGRGFRLGEDLPGAPPVVILTDGFWKRKFGADPNVIGRSVTLDGDRSTVIGVLPPTAYVGYEQVYVPFVLPKDAQNDRYSKWVQVIARVRPGYTLQQAQAEMDVVARRLEKDHAQTNIGRGIRLVRFRDQVAGFLRPTLLLLLCAVGFVLLIACANVSNLLLARAVPRQSEMAIRIAIGASRWRLVRQLLTESLLISIAGATLGLLAARWGLDVLIVATPRFIIDATPYLKNVPIDGAVLAFAIAVCAVAAVVCGFAPAWQVSKRDPQDVLRPAGRGSTLSPAVHRLRGALVAAEISLAMILLVGSGLAVRSLLHVLEVQPGFNPENLLTMRVSLSSGSRKEPQQTIAFQQELIRRLRSIPGTVNAATATVLPLSGKGHPTLFSIQGRDKPAWNTPWTQCLSVDAGYFATMGVPLRAGRSFVEQDNEKPAKVAIVNEMLARTYFPGENPIGKRIIVWRESPEPREIVGVSADIKNNGLDSAVWPEAYVPFAQNPQPVMSVAVRTASDPAALIADVRRVIRQLDKDTSVFDAMPMSDMIAASPALVLRRMPSLLMSLVAAAALLLAAVGIGGVMASMVGQQTQEIGIRMALGAERRNVLWMVLRQSLKLVLIGIAAGLPASLALTRLVTKWLFGVTPLDAMTYISVGVTLIGVALVSCYVPARRAAKVDPAMALRHE